MMNLFWTFCLIPDVFAKEEDSLLEELGLTRHGIDTESHTECHTECACLSVSARNLGTCAKFVDTPLDCEPCPRIALQGTCMLIIVILNHAFSLLNNGSPPSESRSSGDPKEEAFSTTLIWYQHLC